MRFYAIAALALMVLSTAGCPGDKRAGDSAPHITRQVAPPPPRADVPIDAGLAAAADLELTNALHESDPILRVHALEAIRDSNRTNHDAEILHALGDTKAEVRFAAALAAGELKIAAAHDILLSLAEDRSENVRVAVRYALHRLGDLRLSHQLEKLAQDSDPRVRGNTAFVLGMLGEPSALNILRVLRVDPSEPVRQEASEAMWRLGDEEGLKDLVALSFSTHPDDQMIAFLAIGLPGNARVRQHVRVGLLSDYESNGHLEISLVAARAMGMLGSDEGYSVAQAGAASNDPNQRTLAAFALGAIGRSDAQPILKKLLGDSNPSVRIAAAEAILQLKR